jgi:hypothetical protein
MSTAEPNERDRFPLDSFKEAAPFMRRPFAARAVKFKVQSTTPSSGLIVCYIDARLAVERMNLLVPHLWHDEYEALGGKHLICRLTIDGITRQDIGEGAGKGLYSDAIKRAAVKFGVGVSLYAAPAMWLDKGQGLKDGRGKDGKATLTLTDGGERKVREMYAAWLLQTGIPAFGDPLDHGDIENSVGDTEAESSKPIAVPRAPAARRTPKATLDALIEARKGLTAPKVKMAFGAAGVAFPAEGDMFASIGSVDAEKLIAALEQVPR